MNQTPVYFSMNAKRTLELIGEKTNSQSHFGGQHEAGDRGGDDLCRRYASPVGACV